MFTGIIEETGTVESIQPGDKSIRLTLTLRKTDAGGAVLRTAELEGCSVSSPKKARKGYGLSPRRRRQASERG